MRQFNRTNEQKIERRVIESLSRQALIDRLSHYGFIECGMMLTFLHMICDVTLGVGELTYLRDKIKECLNEHDNQSDYFNDLRKLYAHLDEGIIYFTTFPR